MGASHTIINRYEDAGLLILHIGLFLLLLLWWCFIRETQLDGVTIDKAFGNAAFLYFSSSVSFVVSVDSVQYQLYSPQSTPKTIWYLQKHLDWFINIYFWSIPWLHQPNLKKWKLATSIHANHR